MKTKDKNLEKKTLDALGDKILAQLKSGEKKVEMGKLGYFYTQLWPQGNILGFSPTQYALKEVNNGNDYSKQ